jgi:putative endonuclease
MKAYKLGLAAEQITKWLYRLAFYQVTYHRRKNFVGEIDLIAIRGKQIVFIEVKARNHAIDSDVISKKQQERIRRSAALFLSQNVRYQHYDVRFDLVFIRPYKLPLIIKNAW